MRQRGIVEVVKVGDDHGDGGEAVAEVPAAHFRVDRVVVVGLGEGVNCEVELAGSFIAEEVVREGVPRNRRKSDQVKISCGTCFLPATGGIDGVAVPRIGCLYSSQDRQSYQ